MGGYAKGMTEADQALFTGCSWHRPVQVAEALAMGARPDARDADGQTPLHAMAIASAVRKVHDESEAHCAEKCAQIARALVEAGADMEGLDNDGHSAMEHAAIGHRADAIQALLGEGALMRMALCLCADHGHSLATVRMLVEAGADPLARDKKGRTALECARSAWGGADEATVAYLEGAEIGAQLAQVQRPAGPGAQRI